MNLLFSLMNKILKEKNAFIYSAQMRNINVNFDLLELIVHNIKIKEFNRQQYNKKNISKEELENIEKNYNYTDIELWNIINSFPNKLSEDVKKEDQILKIINCFPEIKNKYFNEELKLICRQQQGNFRVLLYTSLGLKLINLLTKLMKENAFLYGFKEETVPITVNQLELFYAGLLPNFKNQLFNCDNDFLIPTAEVKLLKNNIKFNNTQRINSFQYAFRKEGGAAGIRDQFIRLNQFSKMELFVICPAENSNEELINIINCATNILKILKINYRLILNSAENTSFQSAKTIDIEVWSNHKQSFIELSSCSNTTDFQSTRAKIKLNNNIPHCLNGTGLALERLIFILLEHYEINELINILSNINYDKININNLNDDVA
jgi:seryl-tRNA synthetase